MRQAPRSLVAILRKGVGDPDLDIKWMPDISRDVARPEEEEDVVSGNLLFLKGCWAVTKATRVWNRSGRFVHPKKFDWPVYVLDGRGDLPLDPGVWLIEIMVKSDLLRQGADRIIELDEARERAAINERAVSDNAIKDFSRQRELYRLMVKAAEEQGAPNLLKEEIKAMERHAEAMLEWDERAFADYLKELRTRR